MKKLLAVSSFMALVSMAVVLIYGSIGWAEETLPRGDDLIMRRRGIAD